MNTESTKDIAAEHVQIADHAERPKTQARKPTTALFNFWVDVALALAVTLLIWISAMLQIVFPAPTLADGWELWGLSYNQWRDAQFYSLCVCALIALEHLVLHWNWVCGVVATKVLRVQNRPGEGAQVMYGIATFVGVLLVLQAAIIAALFTVKRPTP